MAEIIHPRAKTREVKIGEVTIGGNNPIAVQSMVTEETRNILGVVNQVVNLHRVGAEIIRITVPSRQDVIHLKDITRELEKLNVNVPIVADIHHQGSLIAAEAAKYANKIRINPGLFVDYGRLENQEIYSQNDIEEIIEKIEKNLRPVIESCKENGTALRIGVNHGSLSNRMMVLYGDTPEGMVQSALEYIKIFEANHFYNLVLSLKASRVPIMVAANRLMSERMREKNMDYPIHLGVTEAGNGQYARIKSTAGLATLLMEGIGDTIRVSLSENPLDEIPVCYDILQALGRRKTKTEFIGCPSCGRTKFDLPSVLSQVQKKTSHLKDLTIAVMGCIVNGPGEMADSDYGYVGEAGGKITLYRKKEVVKRGIPQTEGLEELICLLKSDGVWIDPS